MKIAVLGAGFAGLGLVWHLLEQNPQLNVTLFDTEEIGGGASGLSSGLLNPFGGLHAKKTWNAEKGMSESKKLIQTVQRSIKTPLFNEGILRPACLENQVIDFKITAQKFPELIWWEKEQCVKSIPSLNLPLNDSGGLFISEGLTVYVQKYLQGLWKLCEAKGATFVKQKIGTVEELNDYDTIVSALGAGSQKLLKEALPPLSTVKGQLLIFEWLKTIPHLPYSLVSQGYLVMSEDGSTCMAGATFERDYTGMEVDLETAKREIIPKIAAFFPPIYDMQILDCKAGARLNYKTHLPLVDKISPKIWIFTAMGSKGLIYHAWIGKLLAEAILNDTPENLPQDFRLKK